MEDWGDWGWHLQLLVVVNGYGGGGLDVVIVGCGFVCAVVYNAGRIKICSIGRDWK